MDRRRLFTAGGELKLGRSGALTGTFESNIKDNDGNVIFTAIGDFTAEPITV